MSGMGQRPIKSNGSKPIPYRAHGPIRTEKRFLGKRPGELLQFNISQPVASVIIGCEQMAPLEQNVQAALNFTPISESGKQKLQEKVAPSRSAWENFLRSHDDTLTV